MARQCYVDNLRASTKPSMEGNISAYVEISIDIKLDPKPPIDQGAKPIEKLEYMPLTDEENRTQIGERMQGPHWEWLMSTFWHHADMDRLVYGALGFPILNFLDAYSGYNQIKMYPLNAYKIAFMADGMTYYYQAMLFDLKNTRATYQ
ncbi:hypothetical protein CR513_42338, partial [Mucuna pruriens]